MKNLSIKLIDPPKQELRSFYTKERLEELVSSIRNLGVLQPILVERVKDRYRVIAGGRRVEAARIAGLDKVPCVVTDLPLHKRFVASIHENFMREDVNYLDLARYLHTIIETYQVTLAEVSKVIGWTPAWTRMILKLLDYPQYLQHAVAARHIDPTSAQELMRVKDETRRVSLLESAVRGGATQQMIRGWVHSELMATGERPKIPPVSGAVGTREEHPPLTFTCACCTQQYPTENMILIRSCSECYSLIQKAFKVMREEGSHGKM